VRGSNSDGVWNQEGTSLGITITPPWWGTTWFRGGLILLAVAGLFGAYRWRVKSFETRSQELETQVEEKTRQLDERVKELTTLLSVSQDIVSTLDLEPLLNLILEQLKVVVDYDVATIRRLKQEAMQLQAYQGLSTQEEQPAHRLPVASVPVIQKMVQTQQAFIINDVQFDPALFGDFDTFEEMPTGAVLRISRTLMGVPLIVKGEVIGMLVLGHRQPDYYDQEMMNLAQAFANQAAVAIVNAELYEQAGEAATLEERTRLARELHDSATQALYSATLFSEAGKELAESGDLESVKHYLSRVSEVVHQALKDMRLLVYQLRPPILEKEGLVGALQGRLDAVERRAGMEARLFSDQLPPLPDDVSEGLYRIAQEALNNALKHADADVITVNICYDGASVTLEILDDGCGFDPQTAESIGGMGLMNMKARTAQLGGHLEIDSTSDNGSNVIVTIPIAGKS
jgi:signal transduction histidine kinase